MTGAARLVTLGSPRLLSAGAADDGVAQSVGGRRIGLLALVAAAGPGGISRDRVLAFLWPEREEGKARHALAQLCYGLRRMTGLPLIRGDAVLRIDPAALTTDLDDLARAWQSNDLAAVVELHREPFLSGFRLPDAAPEFEEWIERERTHLAGLAARAREALGEEAEMRGDWAEAAIHWRVLSEAAPLDVGHLLRLAAALARAGRRSAARELVSLHIQRVSSELSLPADPRVVALAEQLREEPVAPAVSGRVVPRPWRRLPRMVAAAGVLLGVVGAADLLHRPPDVLAVGAIRYLGPDSALVAHELSDMLATSLGRLSGIQVLSSFRVRELAGRIAPGDGAPAVAQAARAGGATNLLEGVVHPAPGGMLRFELREVSLGDGAVRAVYRIDGRDPFELADSATARIAAATGVPRPAEALRTVTTSSLLAYRLYDEGLGAWATADAATAHRLFTAALREDSTFALAAYRAWLAAMALQLPSESAERDRAERLATRAPERERLFIQGTVAAWFSDPGALALADTLAARYPHEPEAFTLLSNVAGGAGEFGRAVEAARTARRLLGPLPAAAGQRCPQCELYSEEVDDLLDMDSLAAAERVAREWIRLQPAGPGGWYALGRVLGNDFRSGPALTALATGDSLAQASPDASFLERETLLLRTGRFREVDRALSARLRDAPDPGGTERWYLFISWRNQGRLADALRLASTGRAGPSDRAPPWHPTDPRLLGQARYESGDYRGAFTAFADACPKADGRGVDPADLPHTGRMARIRAWCLVHQATALAAAGDTAALPALADSIERVGRLSLFGRDVRLHHYVRGLLAVARHQDTLAAMSFRAAIHSPTYGFTRASLELGRTLLRLGRPAEAVPVVQAALRGPLDASNLYVTHTELHELLADAFAAAGRRDSAAAEYRRVAAAWAGADAAWQPRRARAERLARLEGR